MYSERSVNILNIIPKAEIFTNGIELEEGKLNWAIFYMSTCPIFFVVVVNDSMCCLYCVIQLN